MNDTFLTTAEQQQRAKWDLLLTELELRQEQLRQLKPYEPIRLAAQLGTAAAVAGGIVAGAILWIAHLIR